MTTHTPPAGDGVHGLVSQRDQLRAWIAKLDEVQTAAPSRVTERVRADYQDRLRRVTEDLSAHGEEIRRGLEEVRGQLAAAEERRTHAADALEETRLRHLIGELDDAAWERARQPLEDEAAAADEAVAGASAEVDRLSTLSAEIDAGDARPQAGAADAEQPDATGGDGADAADEYEPSLALAADDEPVSSGDGPASSAASPSHGDNAVSGEDLAAWITEVEAEEATPSAPPAAPAPAAPQRQDEAAVEGWDPFSDEFGGGPASPATQPGDAAQELPWLGALEGGAGAGRWTAPAAEAEDELAFLDNLDASTTEASDGPSPDLADDDLAFLEELDRAISGGAASPVAGTDAAAGLGGGFSGGSGDDVTAAPESTQERKQGEALLCKECGAINEPQAWYCEICGSEL